MSRMCPFALIDREGATRRSYIVDHKLLTGKIAAHDLTDRISWEEKGRAWCPFPINPSTRNGTDCGLSAYCDLSHSTTKSNMYRKVYMCSREEGKKKKKKEREGDRGQPTRARWPSRCVRGPQNTDVLEKSRTFTISHMGDQRSSHLSRLHSKVSAHPIFPPLPRLDLSHHNQGPAKSYRDFR